MIKETLTVTGMSCAHCENRVQTALLAIDGVAKCKAKSKKNEVSVRFDEEKTNTTAIRAAIVEAGYSVE